MKVVHIINSVGNGGAEAVLCRVVMHPSPDEHHVISLARPSWHSARLDEKGIDVRYLHMDSVVSIIPSFVELTRQLRHLRPDVVQTWMYRSNLVGGLAAKLVGAPVVWGVHASALDRHSPLLSRVMVRACAAAAAWMPDRIVNCSAQSARLHEEMGYPRSKTAIVRNGLNVEAFHPNPVARRKVRMEFGVSDDAFLIGMVARWHPQKDHQTLLAAMSLLLRRSDLPCSWRCALVGSKMDTGNDELMRGMASYGVGDKALLVGARADVENVMCALDLGVLSSAFGEALPNVIMEAMACGVPCVATNVGDCAYLIGDTGWVAPARSPDRLAECLADAMKQWRSDSGGTWKVKQQAARARIAENFAVVSMYESYATVWSAANRVKPHASANG